MTDKILDEINDKTLFLLSENYNGKKSIEQEVLKYYNLVNDEFELLKYPET